MQTLDVLGRLSRLEKWTRSKQILYSGSPLTGPAGCYVFGIDYSTGDLYYKDAGGNWSIAAYGGGSGGGGGNPTCDTNIDGSTTHDACPDDEQYISLLIDDGATPIPWRGTWNEFKLCLGVDGASQRFALAGEDDVAGEDRIFDNSNFYFEVAGTDADNAYHALYSGPEYSYMENDNPDGDYTYIGTEATPGFEATIGLYTESASVGDSTKLNVFADRATITQFDNEKSIVTSVQDYLADISGNVEIVSTLPNNGLLALASGLFVPTSITDGLVYGGIVTWYANYTYEVTAAGYYIQGIFYESPAYTVAGGNAISLSPADPDNNRIDVFYATTDGTVQVLEGTPSSTPSKPTVAGDQLELSFAVVETGTTEPTTTLSKELIYAEALGEPTEWTPTTTGNIVYNVGGGIEGSYAVQFINSTGGDVIDFVNDVPIQVDDLSVITFKLKFASAQTKQQSKKLVLSFLVGATLVGKTVRLNNGDYGLDLSSTAVQLISIPLTDFNIVSLTTIDTFRILNNSTGNTQYNLVIDTVQLQGVHITAPPVVGGVPTLQEVTDAGNLTDNNMEVVAENSHISVSDTSGDGVAVIGVESTNGGYIQIDNLEGVGNKVTSKATLYRENFLPDGDGFFALSITMNGDAPIQADINGNIDLGIIEAGGGAAAFTSYTRDYLLDVTFDGGSGTGLFGPVTIPDLEMLQGYFIEEVLINVVEPMSIAMGDPGFMIGYTGQPDGGIGTTSANVNTLNANVGTKISANDQYLSTSDSNLLTLYVQGGDINGGRIQILVRVTNYEEPIGGGGSGSGGGGDTPNLQEVTDVGSSTTNIVTAPSFRAIDVFRVIGDGLSPIEYYSQLGIANLYGDFAGILQLKSTTSFEAQLYAAIGLTATTANFLPNVNGTLAVSATVNGGSKIFTDAEGNIDLGTITGGGGGSPLVKEFHVSGSSIALGDTTTWLIVNPENLIPSLSITLPTSPTDGQIVDIDFGGIITSGNEVVTSLTIVGTVVEETTPIIITAGAHLRYRWEATNSLWYKN